MLSTIVAEVFDLPLQHIHVKEDDGAECLFWAGLADASIDAR